MANESLGSMVIDVLENNRKTGKSLIEAYRVGGKRLTSGFESSWERVVEKRAGKLNKKVRSKLIGGAQSVTGFLSTRITKLSNGADKALDKVYDGAATAVHKVAKKVDAIDNAYAVKYFDYAGKVTLPTVKLTRDLTHKLANGVDTVYSRMAPKRKTVRKVARKAPVKRARAKTAGATAKAA